MEGEDRSDECILLILCVYYNYIILKYYFYSLFWAFIVSIPLHHVKVKLSEFLKERFIKKRNKTKTIFTKSKTNGQFGENGHRNMSGSWSSDSVMDIEEAVRKGNEKRMLIPFRDSNMQENKSVSRVSNRGDGTLLSNTERKCFPFQKYGNRVPKKARTDVLKPCTGLLKPCSKDKVAPNVTFRNSLRKSFYKIMGNVRKELEMYMYIFFLIVKPIYKEERKESMNNSFEDYESRNASEIYFLILHRLVFFYILKGIFHKYKEFVLPVCLCLFFFFFFYKIVKIVWMKYFYEMYKKYYVKCGSNFSIDYSYVYKHYMNDILTILIIIFAIITFSSISIFFVFNLYGESVFIINSINNYFSANFKNASIIQNFKEFYRKRGKGDIENLYEFVNLTKIPFLSGKTISSISGHLKRAIDIYENIYAYNFMNKKRVSLNSCCLPLLIERFFLFRENNLSKTKMYILFLKNIWGKKKEFIHGDKQCSPQMCLIKEGKENSVFFSLKKLVNYLSKTYFFSNKTNERRDNSEKTGDQSGRSSDNQNVFKTIFGNIGDEDTNGHATPEEKLPEQLGESDIAAENRGTNGETGKMEKMEKMEKMGKINGQNGNLGGASVVGGRSTGGDLSVRVYDESKERHFKFAEFINYINSLFLSLKKIEDIGKFTKYIIFNNSYGLLKIMLFFVFIFFNFFMFTFDAIIQAIIFFTALYYLISSKKSVLNYLRDILLVVDPSISLSLFLSITTFGSKGLILGPLIGSIPLILHQIAINKNKSTQMKKRQQRNREKRRKRPERLSGKKQPEKKQSEKKQSGKKQPEKKQTGKKRSEKLAEELISSLSSRPTRTQMERKYGHKEMRKFSQVRSIVSYSDQGRSWRVKKRRRQKTLLWKSKLNNLYKLIEINKNYINSYGREQTEKTSCKHCGDDFCTKMFSTKELSNYDDFIHREENKLALYIYKREKNKKKEKKTNHHLISKNIRKSKNKRKIPYQKTKSFVYLYDNFQKKLKCFFSYITSNS
ncbi:conserved Plasmodium protein, unknown function [Plasmodium ovale curtisi]|uniref:Uncharacterized protein n=1 Tax=Plasmodium ovale curtisi TaxID=864141 RepID=A0A1A8WSF3_PLAOA|nr:conserved Plasmodium protein, unknown function [Plasmodium ovale curtisi]